MSNNSASAQKQNKIETDTQNPKPLEEPSYTPPTKKDPEQN